MIKYEFKGYRIREEALVKIDGWGRQIVVLPATKILLARQRLGRTDLAELRRQAVANVSRIARHEPCVYDE